jgi:hypothetical protein
MYCCCQVIEDPDLLSQVTASFWELQFPSCTEEPCSSPSANETCEADRTIMFEDLGHNAMETMVTTGQELGEVEILSTASLEHVTSGIDEFYRLCEEQYVRSLEDDWIMEGSFEFPCSPDAPVTGNTNDESNVSTPVDRMTSFMPWTGTESDGAAVPVTVEPQKLLKKVVAGAAWENNGGSRNTTRSTTQESGIKNHVMSERRRREKLNEMFLILKSMVPTIHKVVLQKILLRALILSHIFNFFITLIFLIK